MRTPGGWIDAPPIPGTFVCNIGDMLDRLTGGWYRSTPHRVRNVSGNDRLSFPFFFDPDFIAEVPPLPGRADPRAFTGTYGDYLLGKVSRVSRSSGRRCYSVRDHTSSTRSCPYARTGRARRAANPAALVDPAGVGHHVVVSSIIRR